MTNQLIQVKSHHPRSPTLSGMRRSLALFRGLLFAISLAMLGSGLSPAHADAAGMHQGSAETTSAKARASDPTRFTAPEATAGHVAEPCLLACCSASLVTGCCVPGLLTELPAIHSAPLCDLHFLPVISSASGVFPDTVYKPPRLLA